MPDAPSNGHLAWNALLLAAVAAGCGWLLYSRTDTLRRRFNGGEGAVARVREPAGRQPSRKMSVAEPMAGYGA